MIILSNFSWRHCPGFYFRFKIVESKKELRLSSGVQGVGGKSSQSQAEVKFDVFVGALLDLFQTTWYGYCV